MENTSKGIYLLKEKQMEIKKLKNTIAKTLVEWI